MYNWSVDEKQFKKADPEAYKLWRLEQMINFGTGEEKLNKAEVISLNFLFSQSSFFAPGVKRRHDKPGYHFNGHTAD